MQNITPGGKPAAASGAAKPQPNQSLNLLKGLACMLVAIAHAPFPAWFNLVLNTVARQAVPLFFMVAGYYMLKLDAAGRPDLAATARAMPGKIRHTLRLLAWALGFYGLASVVYDLALQCVAGHMTVGALLALRLGPQALVRALVFNDTASVFSLSQHLWFVAAQLYSYIAVWAALHWRWLWRLVCGTPLLLLVHYGLRWHWLLARPRPFGIDLADKAWLRSWLFMGLPMMMLGVWLRMGAKAAFGWLRRVFGRHANTALAAGAALATAVSLAECWLAQRLAAEVLEVYLGTTAAILCIFMLALAAPQGPRHSRLAAWLCEVGAKDATLVYVLHGVWVGAWYALRAVPAIAGNALFQWGSPLVVLALSLLTARVLRGRIRV